MADDDARPHSDPVGYSIRLMQPTISASAREQLDPNALFFSAQATFLRTRERLEQLMALTRTLEEARDEAERAIAEITLSETDLILGATTPDGKAVYTNDKARDAAIKLGAHKRAKNWQERADHFSKQLDAIIDEREQIRRERGDTRALLEFAAAYLHAQAGTPTINR